MKSWSILLHNGTELLLNAENEAEAIAKEIAIRGEEIIAQIRYIMDINAVREAKRKAISLVTPEMRTNALKSRAQTWFDNYRIDTECAEPDKEDFQDYLLGIVQILREAQIIS